MTRTLQSTVRTISGSLESYQEAWTALAEAAARAGVRAWIFQAADEPSRFIEFLEWKQAFREPASLSDSMVRTRCRALEQFGTGTTQLWVEP